MTDTTQPHPEPSEEASSLPVVISTAPERIYLVIGEDCPPDARWDQLAEVLWCEDNIDGNGIVYVREDLAQAQLNAMRVERDAALRGRCRIAIPTETMEQEFQSHFRRGYVAALKAAPVVDVEAIMRLAEQYARACTLDERVTFEHMGTAAEEAAEKAMNAAREALRAALASPEGSPR